MNYLNPTPSWDDVAQVETTTPLLGGPGGPLNVPAQALLNRTELLKARHVADYASLRATVADVKAIYVTGYLASTTPSGIAGMFVRDDSDTTTADNGGTVIVASNGKRWKRMGDGRINFAWFGADPALADNRAAIQSALDAGGIGSVVYGPAGAFKVSGTLTRYPGQVIEGSGWATVVGSYAIAGGTQLVQTSTADVALIQIIGASDSDQRERGGLRNIALKHTNTNSTVGTGYKAINSRQNVLDNVYVSGFNIGIEQGDNCWQWSMRAVRVMDAAKCLFSHDEGEDSTYTSCTFRPYRAGGIAVHMKNMGQSNLFNGCDMSNGATGLLLEQGDNAGNGTGMPYPMHATVINGQFEEMATAVKIVSSNQNAANKFHPQLIAIGCRAYNVTSPNTGQIFIDAQAASLVRVDGLQSQGYSTGINIGAKVGIVHWYPGPAGQFTTIATGNLSRMAVAIDARTFGAVGDGVTDDTAAIQAAINAAAGGGGRVELPPTDSFYKVTASLDMRTAGSIQFIGRGLPTIQMATANTPIILMGGERQELRNMKLQFAALPLATDTNAVAIRCYNLYESIIDRIYFYQVYGAMDQYQGSVNGGQNAFYSNTVSNIRCVYFKGWAINMQPYLGGNSGNFWNNIYINNRNASGAASSNYSCLGGIYLKTAQNDVFNLLNLEWMAYTGCAMVLNQCGNAVFNGLHIEGNYCTNPYQPMIDVSGSDGSTHVINGLTLVGNDFSGANPQALFRMNSTAPARVQVNGLLALNNTGNGNVVLLTYGGSSAYGCFLEVSGASVLDTSIASDPDTPKVQMGAVISGKEYPLQRWNQWRAHHSAAVTDDVGGTQSTNATMPGLLGNPVFDTMGMWTSASNRFYAKVQDNYLCSVNIPTGSSPAVQVKKNGTTVALLTLTAQNTSASALVQMNVGDYIEFYLASGSYTRTGVVFGVSRF
jgi:hypothetical protein